jgi:hypothetical protein
LARFLALDWDHKQLHLIAAAICGGVVRIEKALVWQEERVPNPAEAEALGKLLRERLKESGIAPAPLLACVGRDRVILKDLRFPAVPDAEEPAVVRFQAVKELTDPADEVVIDYARVGDVSGERRALALIARRELVNAYQTLARAAGLKLVALTPRPFGVAACLEALIGASALTPSPEPLDGTVAVIALGEHWGEFCMVREGALLFARAVQAGPGLAGEVRRNLAVHAAQVPQHPVCAVYVAGGSEHATLREQLRDMLDIPVCSFDPFAGVDRPDLPHNRRGGFSGAVGLLHVQAARDEFAINFVKPRQAKPPRDPNKRRLVFVGALAATLLLAGVTFCYMQLNALNQDINAQAIRNGELDKMLSTLGEDDKKFKALSDWDRKGVILLDEIYDVTERFGDPKTIQLTRLYVTPRDEAKDKHVARITLEGIISGDPKQVDQLMDRLGQAPHRRLDAPKTEPNRGGIDSFNFRVRFTTSVDVEKPRPDKYTVRLPDPPARNGQGAEGGEQ